MPLSTEVAKAMRLARKHFRFLTEDLMPHEVSRYDGWWDFATVAIRKTIIIENNIMFDGEISIGSNYLSDQPWMILGNYAHTGIAKYKLNSFNELIEHYKKSTRDFPKVECLIPFAGEADNLFKLSNRHYESVEDVMGMSLLLMRDLIFHSGPDSETFFDLFTNDARDNPENIDLDTWERNRCKLFGRFGCTKDRTSTSSYNRSEQTGCSLLPKKKRFRKCNVDLKLISRNASLLEGLSTAKEKW